MKAIAYKANVKSDIDIQYISSASAIPLPEKFKQWVQASLGLGNEAVELSIRVVDIEESQALNKQYRNKDKPTNVLSFPLADENLPISLLGDLVICAPVVELEAQQQGKDIEAHWAHMVVHGVLHLQGYDHDLVADAKEMEALELKIMQGLGYSDPYSID